MPRNVSSSAGHGPSAVHLVEEAVHLLRRAPVSTWAIYALGSCPWVLGLLFFWAHTTWFAPSSSTIAWSALGLALLFVGLKTMQAEFCGRLLAQRLGAPVPTWETKRLLRLASLQARLQCWGIVAVPISLVLSLPFGWAYAYFQTLSVLGAPARHTPITSEAFGEAQRWPGQNHLGLLYVSVLAFAGWVNLAATFYAVPWLANRLLGIENVFGLSGWGWFNTTFLMSVTALTWLCVDPLVKAFYVLRVFYGRSQRTAEDLRVDLLASSRKRRSQIAAALLVLLAFAVVPARLHAEAARVHAPEAVNPAALDHSLDRVLERRDFQWQMRPKPRADVDETKSDGPIMRFIRRGLRLTRDVFQSVMNSVGRFFRWVRDLFGDKDPESHSGKSTGVSTALLHTLLYALIAVAVILIIAAVIFLLPTRRGRGLQTMSAQPVLAKEPDLADENVEATHLPSDGWIALAREQMAKGEWRLALRALYLATLAQLAAEGLITLIKSKTNLDYERELRRRAPAHGKRIESFAVRRQEFESVWYGRGIAAEEAVRAWFDEFRGGLSP